jgi:DNA invertase Pin-like site-specific DNA recombinase
VSKLAKNQLQNYGAKVMVHNNHIFQVFAPMKIGYARVSTDAQETHLQMDALTRAKCSRIYQEKASGAKADRPELTRLLDNARKGDVIVVWKLDRLARSLRQLIDTTVLLNERGVELHSLTENINTTTPNGKLTFHLFAALAEFERDLLRQRVNAGLKAARRRGRVGGRPKSLTDDDLKKARALLRSGDYTKVQVAKELEVSRHTLWRALAQEPAP